MIPKRIFLFWGGTSLTWLRHLTLVSLCELNPDYAVEVYLPEETDNTSAWASGQKQDFSTYGGVDYLRSYTAPNLTIKQTCVPLGNGMHQADWFKWRELSEGGGWFSDLDILYVKPLPTIDADAVVVHGRHYAMGLMASSGDSDLYREIYDASIKCYDAQYYDSTNQIAMQVVGIDVADLQTKFPLCRIATLPMDSVYPWDYNKANKYFEPGQISDSCIGLHWYAGTPVGHANNMALTPDNAMGGIVQDEAARLWRSLS